MSEQGEKYWFYRESFGHKNMSFLLDLLSLHRI